jgi:hypothetical protein
MVPTSMHPVKMCMNMHPVKMRMNTHPVKKLGMDRQTRIDKSPCVQHSSIGTARVARANMRWRREQARGKSRSVRGDELTLVS